MKMSEAFPGKYLKAGDLPEDTPVTVRMDRVEMEDVSGKGKKEMKPVLFFIGKEKGVVLNKTNTNTISAAYGDDSENWHGKPIQIFRTETEYAGERVDCIRMRVPKSAPSQNGGGQGKPALAARREEITNRAPAESPVSEEEQFTDDSIPF
jgi:hypothetical protein